MTKKKKILAFRFSAMGDVAMVVPVIKSVVKQNPDIEIIMVSRPFFKAFFSNIPQVQFIGVDLKKYKGILGLFQLFRELKKNKPTEIADLHDVLRTKILRIFFKLSGYKVAVINKGRKEKKALTALKNKTLKPLKSTHQRYADVFEKLGVSVKIILDTNTSVNNLSVQVQLFLQTFESKKLIGIAPFAAHTGKQYPLDKIEEVIEQILEKDKQVNILLFGGGETEKKKLDQLEKINRNRIVNVAGMFNFSEELQLISQLNLMLSMDSGNGHLAAMLNVPVVTIWGATHPYAGFAPLGQKNTQQILPDLKQFPQLPTSVYGNKIFEGFEAVWNTIPTKKVTQLVFENLQDL